MFLINRGTPQALVRHKSWFIGMFQAGLVMCSLTTAWLLRFDLVLPQRRILLYALPVLVLTRLGAMGYFGLLGGWWRNIDSRGGGDILKGVTTGSIVFFLIMRFVLRVYAFPRAIYLLEPLVTTGILAGVRLMSRLPFHTLPALPDVSLGKGRVIQLRDVSLEDLLGRDPVQIDLEAVRCHLRDKSVMVTGAAGSIGSELCRQILKYGPCKLVCVDQNETGMFYLQQELRRRSVPSRLVCCVADVSNVDGMHSCFSNHRVDHTFHAAAYKHVPVMEENVAEAIRNNVFALESLVNVAEEEGCKSFVLISSDKAVNPASVMGSSKRIGELMLAARPKKNMRCVSVRFGNVLGSTGSVVPILQKQLEEGRPFTITHPEIRRFFMTTQEAVSLVLGAFAIGHDGDILVLEMGNPVKIVDIARALIRLSGRPEDSISIQFTGLREGEKLEEQLCYDHETILPTSFDKIRRINGSTPDWAELCLHLKELRATLNVDGAGPIRAKIKDIVPEYRCSSDLAQDISRSPERETLLKSASAHD